DLSRIPLIEDSEEMTTDKTIEPQDSPPTTETYNLLPAPSNLAELETFEGRQALLEQWLNIWLEHLNNEPFSPQPFLDAAQQRLSELTEDNPLEWELGAADYEQITKWLIKSLDNGNIKQIYENTKNQVQVKAANP
ncbi:MAG: hypothetical protein VKL42_04445, partial [Snowella sp.]|nr:hypothetical protein [Snowella sp.]